MKHFGFTLAEVLIVLGLIGGVAALTVPTFVANAQRQQYGARLSATITEVENAFQSMLAAEDAGDLSETTFVTELKKTKNSDNIAKTLIPYLNIETYADTANNLNSSYNGYFKSIKTGSSAKFDSRIVVKLKNGAIVFFHYYVGTVLNEEKVKAAGGSNNQRISGVVIDVNGISPPNTWGRDTFRFILGNDGILYPYGSKTAYILITKNVDDANVAKSTWDKSENVQYACSGNVKYNGSGCTARLIENNFKMDY